MQTDKKHFLFVQLIVSFIIFYTSCVTLFICLLKDKVSVDYFESIKGFIDGYLQNGLVDALQSKIIIMILICCALDLSLAVFFWLYNQSIEKDNRILFIAIMDLYFGITFIQLPVSAFYFKDMSGSVANFFYSYLMFASILGFINFIVNVVFYINYKSTIYYMKIDKEISNIILIHKSKNSSLNMKNDTELQEESNHE